MVQRSTVRELKTEGRLEVAQQLFLNLVRTQDLLMRDVATLLKAHGLSEPQYNVLRVLRAAGDPGLPCRAIGRRMLTRVPDVTRLVDRLEAASLVERRRDIAADRRVVTIRLDSPGRQLLAKLDQPMIDLHTRQFAGLGQDEKRELKRLLVKLRVSRHDPARTDRATTTGGHP